MLTSSTQEIAGYSITETMTIVSGNTVHSKHIGRDILAGLKSIVGGEIEGYTEMLNEARDKAHARMIKAAEDMGADAIVNIRYTTSNIAQTMSELLAYGTAVKLEKR